MNRLHDIRLLKLAEMHERAYESFVLELTRQYVRDPVVQREAEKLVAAGHAHTERIAELLGDLNADVASDESAAIERAALLDILEVERAAREFYLRHLEEAQDERVSRLFRDLLHEETLHVRAAEGALATHDRRHSFEHTHPQTRAAARAYSDDA